MSSEQSQGTPLDKDEYTHQARLLLALHSARPVIVDGKQQFLHTIRAQVAGGRVEMEAYLAGSQIAIDSAHIELSAPLEESQ